MTDEKHGYLQSVTASQRQIDRFCFEVYYAVYRFSEISMNTQYLLSKVKSNNLIVMKVDSWHLKSYSTILQIFQVYVYINPSE